MTNVFESAFAEVAPELTDRRVDMINLIIDRLEAKHGDLGLARRALSSAWGYEGADYRLVSSMLKYSNESDRGMVIAPRERDPDRIRIQSERETKAQIGSFTAKLTKKLAALDSVNVNRIAGASFLITGKLGGRAVRVEQSVVLKRSKNGKLFNQFPARIYVDGKFTPEKAFKEINAENGESE